MALFQFALTSRYYSSETATLDTADGQTIRFLRRRFVPPPERLALFSEHVVTDGERLDAVAAQHLGDPEAFWRIADANRAMRPQDLTAGTGRRLRITLPDGIPGTPNA
jgi:hypothetical protein